MLQRLEKAQGEVKAMGTAEEATTTASPSDRRLVFVTYSDGGNPGVLVGTYNQNQDELEQSAIQFGPPSLEVRRINRSSIEPAFAHDPVNARILAGQRGFFLWKPYIILRALNDVRDGDVVMYMDTRYWFVHNMSCLFEPWLEHDDIVLYNNKPNEAEYFLYRHLKADTAQKYNISNLQFSTVEPWAGLLVLRKSERSVRFVQDWLSICRNYHDISDEKSKVAGDYRQIHPTYDQALLGVAKIRHNVKSHILPSWELQNQRYPWKTEWIPCSENKGLKQIRTCVSVAAPPCNSTTNPQISQGDCLMGRGKFDQCIEGLDERLRPQNLKGVPAPRRPFPWLAQDHGVKSTSSAHGTT